MERERDGEEEEGRGEEGQGKVRDGGKERGRRFNPFTPILLRRNTEGERETLRDCCQYAHRFSVCTQIKKIDLNSLSRFQLCFNTQ